MPVEIDNPINRYTKAKERVKKHYSSTQFDERYTTIQE